MPTKRTFDLILVVAVLSHSAFALARMWARRQVAEGSAIGSTVGAATQVALGR